MKNNEKQTPKQPPKPIEPLDLSVEVVKKPETGIALKTGVRAGFLPD